MLCYYNNNRLKYFNLQFCCFYSFVLLSGNIYISKEFQLEEKCNNRIISGNHCLSTCFVIAVLYMNQEEMEEDFRIKKEFIINN